MTHSPPACHHGFGCKVLLVEDDLLLRQVIGILLEAEKIEFCSAGTGPQFLELMRSHKAKLLILDISLPGMSGFDIVQIIKNDPEFIDYRSVNLVVHTSHDLSFSEQETLALGPTVFVVKTLGDSLPAQIKKMLKAEQERSL